MIYPTPGGRNALLDLAANAEVPPNYGASKHDEAGVSWQKSIPEYPLYLKCALYVDSSATQKGAAKNHEGGPEGTRGVFPKGSTSRVQPLDIYCFRLSSKTIVSTPDIV